MDRKPFINLGAKVQKKMYMHKKKLVFPCYSIHFFAVASREASSMDCSFVAIVPTTLLIVRGRMVYSIDSWKYSYS